MRPIRRPLLLAAMLLGAGPAPAQVPPTPAEVAAYRDLHAAAARDDADAIRRLAAAGAYLLRRRAEEIAEAAVERPDRHGVAGREQDQLDRMLAPLGRRRHHLDRMVQLVEL